MIKHVDLQNPSFFGKVVGSERVASVKCNTQRVGTYVWVKILYELRSRCSNREGNVSQPSQNSSASRAALKCCGVSVRSLFLVRWFFLIRVLARQWLPLFFQPLTDRVRSLPEIG